MHLFVVQGLKQLVDAWLSECVEDQVLLDNFQCGGKQLFRLVD